MTPSDQNERPAQDLGLVIADIAMSMAGMSLVRIIEDLTASGCDQAIITPLLDLSARAFELRRAGDMTAAQVNAWLDEVATATRAARTQFQAYLAELKAILANKQAELEAVRNWKH